MAVAGSGPMRRAVFLDKDGTLVDDLPYNVDPRCIRLAAGADRLAALAAAGFALVVVSNQAGVADGRFTEAALAGVERRLGELLAGLGVALSGFYYCPHDPDGALPVYRRDCLCRKPSPGLLHRAAGELGVELADSWLVGDILDDIEAGRRAGCRTVLIDNGNETQWRLSRERLPHHIAADLGAAAGLIAALEDVPSDGITAAAGRAV